MSQTDAVDGAGVDELRDAVIEGVQFLQALGVFGFLNGCVSGGIQSRKMRWALIRSSNNFYIIGRLQRLQIKFHDLFVLDAQENKLIKR